MSSRNADAPDAAAILCGIGKRVAELSGEYQTEQSLRDKVRSVVKLLKDIRRLGRHSFGPKASARDRIIFYMKEYVGEVIDSEELAVVSGISEYARRIRELRVEHGYHIVSGVGRPDIRPSQYILVEPDPNLERVSRWRLANGIRRQGGSAKDRILTFFKANVGKVITGDELAYVAKIKEWARRVRELRVEDGWVISTNALGRPDLRPGEYVLETLEQVEPSERSILEDVAEAVYRRDNYTCVRCGWTRSMERPEDRRYLNLHHIKPIAEHGTNDADNLQVRCSVCHKQAHTSH